MSKKLLLLATMSGAESVNPLLYDEGEEGIDWVEGYSMGTGSQSKGGSYFSLSASAVYGQRTYVIDRRIPLLRYSSLKADWQITDGGQGSLYLCISTSKDENHSVYEERVERTGSFTRGTDTMDISGINGKFYVRVHLRASITWGLSARVYKVWLE